MAGMDWKSEFSSTSWGDLAGCLAARRPLAMPQCRLFQGKHIVDAVSRHGHRMPVFCSAFTSLHFCSGVTRPKTRYFSAAASRLLSVFSVEAST